MWMHGESTLNVEDEAIPRPREIVVIPQTRRFGTRIHTLRRSRNVPVTPMGAGI